LGYGEPHVVSQFASTSHDGDRAGRVTLTRAGATAILVIGIAAAAALLFARMAALPTLAHDDAISYLAATCHQGLFAVRIPVGQWVAARVWQAYWQPADFACFGRIATDLANYDIHPPLYFWVLHVWSYLVGAGLRLALVLNLGFYVLTALIIYRLCRLLRCAPYIAVVAAVAWALSESTLTVPTEVRQYTLFGLVSAAFILSLVVFVSRTSRLAAGALYVTAVAGLLVHYQFPILLGCAVLGAGFILVRARQSTALRRMLIAIVLAVLTAVAMDPHFLRSVTREQAQAAGLALREVVPRVTMCVQALLEFGMPHDLAVATAKALAAFWPATLGVCLVGIIAVVRWLGRRQRPTGTNASGQLAAWLPAIVAGLVVAVDGLLYVLGVTPAHAMNPEYMIFASPLLFVVGAQALDGVARSGRGRRWLPAILATVLVWQAFIAVYTTGRFVQAYRALSADGLPGYGGPIVLDSVARGVLPTILWHVAPTAPVYAASQDSLLEHFPVLGSDVKETLYVSDLRYGNSAAKRDVILKRFNDLGFQSVKPTAAAFAIGTIYQLRKGTAGESP
jgi:hypothetical protein